MPSLADHSALQGVTVLERGWLSSNNLLVADAERGALLVDSGHVNHAGQTLALVQRALDGQALARIVNTHLHSDHCGGNATLQRAFGASVFVPESSADAVRDWRGDQLSYDATGQRCERFTAQGVIRAGEVVRAGGRSFEVFEAPGHDPRSMLLFDRAHGLLVSADGLWENGFGVVFPELDGEPGFDDVARVLDVIDHLPVQLVVPGHGAPFTDVAGALARARSRLKAFVAAPQRHARHGAKVLIKYHVMEVRAESDDALRRWAVATPLLRTVWEAHGRGESSSTEGWVHMLALELVEGGALKRAGDGFGDA